MRWTFFRYVHINVGFAENVEFVKSCFVGIKCNWGGSFSSPRCCQNPDAECNWKDAVKVLRSKLSPLQIQNSISGAGTPKAVSTFIEFTSIFLLLLQRCFYRKQKSWKLRAQYILQNETYFTFVSLWLIVLEYTSPLRRKTAASSQEEWDNCRFSKEIFFFAGICVSVGKQDKHKNVNAGPSLC